MVSSGEIRDRSKEMLAPADIAIARLYRALLALPRAVQQGQEPPGLRSDLSHVRGLSALISTGERWQTLLPSQVTPTTSTA